MGSRGRPFFDLNEPPSEEEEESISSLSCQPHKMLDSAMQSTSTLFVPSNSSQWIVNNHGFSHASSVSGFQPFVRVKDANCASENIALKMDVIESEPVSSPSSRVDTGGECTGLKSTKSENEDCQVMEREEGELSGKEGNTDTANCSDRDVLRNKDGVEDAKIADMVPNDVNSSGCTKDEVFETMKEEKAHESLALVPEIEQESCKSLEGSREDGTADGLDETPLTLKPKVVKGVEASYALKCANNPGKRNKLDEHKEAMLGKKRNRQTMFLNLEDVKQAGPMKTSTPRRQPFSSSLGTRTVKEIRTILAPPERLGDKQVQLLKDHKKSEFAVGEGSSQQDLNEYKAEPNGDLNQGTQFRIRKLNVPPDATGDRSVIANSKQVSWKASTDLKLSKGQQGTTKRFASANQNRDIVESKPGNKKYLTSKKQNSVMQYLDTSVERLIREVTSEKFWHHTGQTELQCVPGKFESVEEYVRVFEPLLFEECQAQLYSTWDELTETVSRDAHIMVRVKSIERRERGWYDVVVLPVHDCKWTFKEGDVGVLSSPRPGTVRLKRKNNSGTSEDDADSEVVGRVAGTVRRHIPVDTRDPPGAILHFYVGDSFDSSSKLDDDHVLRKLQPKVLWYLTVLGSLATTQREYVALHAFRRLNLQMQTAILKPSPEQFPKYGEQPPAMPECFTPNFVEHLHKTFNGPQLAAIQWAAMHTAAGTSSSGISKRQEPWPFTLVQGPPGTGKTHTVWGMLNVIHLVQYQHYYTALLKKLAPESYKQPSESNPESVNAGSIDEVLQSMDQNLFRTLPKLCPKPRMLVCAPSNAATDELLTRVLDRGFIDGEMKVYRPDVARVGVDSQTRAAQAVSVERRTEQLLVKSREEVIGWMNQLGVREAQFSQQIACLQRELNVAAVAGRSQGSVGVDPDVLVARDHNRDALLQNLAAAVEGRDKVLVEMSRLLILEGRFRAGSGFNLEEARSNLEASFANEAEIVFTTVSSSGRKLFSRLTHGFDMVVIDEAAQASEVAVLPPLSLGAARCVLVGDPQQLPATVISKAAGTLLYSRSLFERFQQAGCPTMLLSVQYRMHPQIREFPSSYFYQGRLTDSESVVNLPDEAYYKDPLLKPYIFYDITHGRESHRGGSVSYQNIHEAQFCLRMYEHLQKSLKSASVGTKVTVGIITPYKLQLKCLQREFEEVLNSEEGKDLYINTVDAFQGQERDVIIMSCVRASGHGVGFVADIRRMNVALTRARRALWVMGNANSLVQSEDWAALISDAKERNCFRDMDSLPKELLSSKLPSNYPPASGKGSSNARGARLGGGRRHSRQHDMLSVDSRSATPSEDDEKSNAYTSRNGTHRHSKQPENNLDEFEPRKRFNAGGLQKRVV